jgi:hypothetical protein
MAFDPDAQDLAGAALVLARGINGGTFSDAFMSSLTTKLLALGFTRTGLIPASALSLDGTDTLTLSLDGTDALILTLEPVA